MLVLLIIFMVVTPMLQHGVTVALPTDLNNPEEDARIIREDAIVISIPKDEEFYLGKIKVGTARDAKNPESRSDLQRTVETMLKGIKEEKDKVVYIKSGVGVQYGQVVDIINQVRALGVDKIGLVADKKKGAAPPAAKPAT